MDEQQIKEQISYVFNGHRNMFTPDIDSYGLLNQHYCYEISTGPKFLTEEMWGFTVVPTTGKKRDDKSYELSGRFSSKEEIIEYIKNINLEK